MTAIRYFLYLLAAILISQSVSAQIGEIDKLRGRGDIVRDAVITEAELEYPIEKLDTVRTGNGTIRVTFNDGTNVSITEHSKLVIDDFVYGGEPSASGMRLRFAGGTMRYRTGLNSAIPKSNIDLSTPTATIAVRGTEFVAAVDPLGSSLIVLVPDETGETGEISIKTESGEVVLNQPFQTSYILNSDLPPSPPKVINYSFRTDFNNSIIISPPDEISNVFDDVPVSEDILDEDDFDYIEREIINEQQLTAGASGVVTEAAAATLGDDGMLELQGITISGAVLCPSPDGAFCVDVGDEIIVKKETDVEDYNFAFETDADATIIFGDGEIDPVVLNEGASGSVFILE
ncbi:MAG: FecR family protein [Henriciella sp.]